MTPRKPKIVVTHIVSGDIWAGAEAQVFQLVQRLSENKMVTPSVVVFNTGALYQKLKDIGVYVEVANEKELGPVALIKAIKKHLIRHKTHVVHTHGFKENILGTIAQQLAGVPNSLRTVHGNPETPSQRRSPKRKIINLMDKLAARFGQNALVAVSGQLYKQLSEEFPGKTTMILNFIDAGALSTKRSNSSPLNGRADFVLGLVGRLVPVKRVDLFLETIAVLRERHQKSVTGVVIGDGQLLEDLRQRASSLGLSEHVTFTGFSNNVHEDMLALDALLMPSDHEGLPMTLLEALALRVPIISHNTGGIPEVLNDGHCGFLVDRHTPEGYAEAVLTLMGMDHNEVEQMTRRGFDHLANNFDSRKNSEKYESLYGQLVNS
jgi:glycosyltransferase involved in cell wall biosynthesis